MAVSSSTSHDCGQCHKNNNVAFADVAIETVASFNKMKTLTSDISIVVQVMKKSDILEVL